MESVRILRGNSRTAVEILESHYALVEFEEEECTAVVPFQRIFSDSIDLEAVQRGDTVKVLWNDKREYQARFILSGSKSFCQTEEDRLLNESNEGSDNCDQESTADINAAELADADKENAGEKKRRRRKKKSDKGEFIVKTGKVPLRSIPLNVSNVINVETMQTDEEIIRKSLEPYTGQVVELYSSDDEDEEFYRCCALVEQGFKFDTFGTVNKCLSIPISDGDEDGMRSSDPVHYTGGVKQLEYETLQKTVNSLEMTIKQNEEKQVPPMPPHDQYYDQHLSTYHLQQQQNMFSSMLIEVKKMVQDPLKSLQEEVKELKSEVNELQSKIDQQKGEGSEKKVSRRLPKPLTSAVRRLHDTLENKFDNSKLYTDPGNAEVATVLISNLQDEFSKAESANYPDTLIRRAVYRRYDSLRRSYNDGKPSRAAAKEANERRTKVRNRQRQLYSRRLKLLREKEKKFWLQIDDRYMSEEETDDDESNVFVRRKPSWRSSGFSKQ